MTADHVFRAVVEDWESALGYVGVPVDVNVRLSGGASNKDDFPEWTGIDAGVERMVGLLQLLTKYLSTETSLPVSVPLGVIVDLITRILSVAIPSSSQKTSGQGNVRLHPAVERDERDGLWSGMPQIYVAALEVASMMAERLQEAFMPMGQGLLDQLAWVFPYGKHDPNFRRHSYWYMALLLPQIGQGLDKATSSKVSGIIRSCCNDLIAINPKSSNLGHDVEPAKKLNGNTSNTNQNADLFLQNNTGVSLEVDDTETVLTIAAKNLLPLFLSHIPQQHLDISLRSLIERTAILSQNKEAMIAGIVNPFVGRNGKPLTSILPHLTRAFPHDETVELLLRPRMPLLPSTGGARLFTQEGSASEVGGEEMEMEMEMETNTDQQSSVDAPHGNDSDVRQSQQSDASPIQDITMNHSRLSPSLLPHPVTDASSLQAFGTKRSSYEGQNSRPDVQLTNFSSVSFQTARAAEGSVAEAPMEDASDSDESVHLTMQLDTDSELED